MNKEALIALVVFLSILAAVITLTIFILVRNSKYKRFVLSNSESIKKLEELNNKYDFIIYEPNIDFYHRFDNKGYWNKTEPVAYLSREIRNNLEVWFKLRSKIESNRTLLNEYKSDISKINIPISADVCTSAKMRYKKCLKTESKLFNERIQEPDTDVRISVKLRYVSRKGKVDLTKNNVFGYIELVRILDSVSTARVDRKTYERLATAERAMLSDGMRYDVLKRDGFRCVLCGMSSKDGAVLHVDHIIPVSKGGKSVMSNLRTLCEKCNIGKSNKIE